MASPATGASPPKVIITITLGDVAENHARMQQIGSLAEEGFTLEDLKEAQDFFEKKGVKTEGR